MDSAYVAYMLDTSENVNRSAIMTVHSNNAETSPSVDLGHSVPTDIKADTDTDALQTEHSRTSSANSLFNCIVFLDIVPTLFMIIANAMFASTEPIAHCIPELVLHRLTTQAFTFLIDAHVWIYGATLFYAVHLLATGLCATHSMKQPAETTWVKSEF